MKRRSGSAGGRRPEPVEGWVILATAPNKPIAEMWVDHLRERGIPARLHPGDYLSYLGVSSATCRVMVPKDRAADARASLMEEMGVAEEAFRS